MRGAAAIHMSRELWWLLKLLRSVSESEALLSKTARRAIENVGRRAGRGLALVVGGGVVGGGEVVVDVVMVVVVVGGVVVEVLVVVVGVLEPWLAHQCALAAACRSLFVRGLGLGLRFGACRGRFLFCRKKASCASRILYLVAWGRFVTLVGRGDRRGGRRGGRHGVQTALEEREELVARVGVSNFHTFLS